MSLDFLGLRRMSRMLQGPEREPRVRISKLQGKCQHPSWPWVRNDSLWYMSTYTAGACSSVRRTKAPSTMRMGRNPRAWPRSYPPA
jgi:hypothetical protein